MIAALATAQINRPADVLALNLPYGAVTRLAFSLDGSPANHGVAYQNGVNDGPQMWIDYPYPSTAKVIEHWRNVNCHLVGRWDRVLGTRSLGQ